MAADRKTIFNYIAFALYAIVCLSATALFIFEVPKIVFYAPVILFATFLMYRLPGKYSVQFSSALLVFVAFTVVFIIFNYDTRQSFYYQTYIHIQAVMMLFIGEHFFAYEEPLEKKLKLLDRYLLAISVMYIAYVTITFIHYYNYTPADLEVRFYYSIWYRFVKKPATVISMSLVIPLTYGIYSLFFSPWYKKIIGICFIGFTMAVNIYTATRTLVYLAPILLLAEFMAYMCLKKKKYKTGAVTGGIVAAFLGGIFLYYRINKDTLYAKYSDTVFSRFLSHGIQSSERWKFTKYVLDHFSFTYFGSGYNSAECGTPHNIWLYIYDYGGIVSFIIYCAFTVLLVINFIRFLRNKNVPLEAKCLISTLCSLIFVEYMLEPFILPLPSFYILTLFVFGIFSGLAGYPNKRSERKWYLSL